MLPPWMNLYAILTMATVLASIVGVSEMMTQTGRALAAENRPELLIPFYSFVLVCFFAYCYPIAVATRRIERRYQVKLLYARRIFNCHARTCSEHPGQALRRRPWTLATSARVTAKKCQRA
jgi:hypothetical protein